MKNNNRAARAARTLVAFFDEVYQTTTGSLSKHDVDGCENVTKRFCNHFWIIQSHYAWKMCSNYTGIKLEPALGT